MYMGWSLGEFGMEWVCNEIDNDFVVHMLSCMQAEIGPRYQFLTINNIVAATDSTFEAKQQKNKQSCNQLLLRSDTSESFYKNNDASNKNGNILET